MKAITYQGHPKASHFQKLAVLVEKWRVLKIKFRRRNVQSECPNILKCIIYLLIFYRMNTGIVLA